MRASDQLSAVFRFINEAKNGGDYYTANLLFVAALHFITKCKRNMAQLAVFCELEVDGGEDIYYDLLVVRTNNEHACIPIPMLADDIIDFCYANCAHVARREHDRRPVPSTPDAWTKAAYGWVRTGEEAMHLFLSPDGLAQVQGLMGRRIGFIEEEMSEIVL